MSYEILSVGDQPANNNGTNGNLSTAPEETPATTVEDSNGNAVETTQATTETQTTEQETEQTTEEPQESVPEYFFGEDQVEVEVPEDIAAAFAEKGIDSNQVLSELFAKGGKFELTPKTKAKLDEAFGKPLVDGYLNLYRQQNKLAVDQFKADAAAQERLHTEITSDFNTLVGGDDGWSELDKWAAENMSEAELASFNAVMQLPPENWKAQRAVIEAMQIKRGAVVEKTEGTGMGELIGDDGEAGKRNSEGLPQTLTMAEFQSMMGTEKYRKDPAYAARVDAIRRASKQAGIT